MPEPLAGAELSQEQLEKVEEFIAAYSIVRTDPLREMRVPAPA